MINKKVKLNSICPHCKKGKLVKVKGYEPYTIDHLMCELCYSTYNIGD